jgi:N-acetyl-beta-hexosaminidase
MNRLNPHHIFLRSPQATYNEEDVKKVVDYAMDRGIRVIPEIDSPAHTRSWSKGYPWVVAVQLFDLL